MLITFLFEFGSALYVLWRYKLTPITRLVALMLLALGTFQLSEYMICGGLNLNAEQWARFGYISITILPALGIHLIATIAGKKQPWLIGAAYATAACFGAYFALVPNAINAEACRPNYAVFHLTQMSVYIYAAYYYGWLLVGTIMSIIWARQHPKLKAPLLWMCIGYLSFMVPTTAANLVDPSTLRGIPSIMCGFAIVLAAILVVCVAPLSKLRVPRKKH